MPIGDQRVANRLGHLRQLFENFFGQLIQLSLLLDPIPEELSTVLVWQQQTLAIS